LEKRFGADRRDGRIIFARDGAGGRNQELHQAVSVGARFGARVEDGFLTNKAGDLERVEPPLLSPVFDFFPMR
jgi:hypothetical protein